MPWLQISITVPKSEAKKVETVFSGFDASAITYSDPGDQAIYEPGINETPLWTYTQLTGLFPLPDSETEFIQNIKTELKLDAPYELFSNQLDDQDWQRAWLKYFKPMIFGTKLWIIPETYLTPDTNAVNIYLDPGLAFGTGSHETTALCLQWLDQHKAENLIVTDYGCGSGILAIAAAKLGAEKVHAIDIDPQAITACNNNAEKNQVNSIISACLASDWQPKPTDLLIANILSGPLIQLAEYFAQITIANGQLVLSGLLASQVDGVKSAYQNHFEDFELKINGEWALLSCRRLV